jgi:hypothetical protein
MFEGINSGRTVLEALYTFADDEFIVQDIFFDVYVNEHPCLCSTCPRVCAITDDEEYDYV